MSRGFAAALDEKRPAPQGASVGILVPSADTERLIEMPPERFVRDERQPRREHDEQADRALLESLENQGQIQPIVVWRREDDRFVIIAGERRWRMASRSKKIGTLQAIVRPRPTDREVMLRTQLDENERRLSLTVIERADVCHELAEMALARGVTLADEAARQHLGASELTRYRAIAEAIDPVRRIAADREVRDVPALYTLARAGQKDPKRTARFVENWYAKKVGGGLRRAATVLLAEIEGGRRKGKKAPVRRETQPVPVSLRQATRENDSIRLSFVRTGKSVGKDIEMVLPTEELERFSEMVAEAMRQGDMAGTEG